MTIVDSFKKSTKCVTSKKIDWFRFIVMTRQDFPMKNHFNKKCMKIFHHWKAFQTQFFVTGKMLEFLFKIRYFFSRKFEIILGNLDKQCVCKLWQEIVTFHCVCSIFFHILCVCILKPYLLTLRTWVLLVIRFCICAYKMFMCAHNNELDDAPWEEKFQFYDCSSKVNTWCWTFRLMSKYEFISTQ